MKTTHWLLTAPAILVFAGCAQQEQHHARFEDATYLHTAQAGSLGYSSSPSASYSADGFSTAPADNNVVSALRKKLLNDPELSKVSPSIQIGASGGSVTLLGKVGNPSQKQSVEALARQVDGVSSVNNQLQVGTTSLAGSSTLGFGGGPNRTTVDITPNVPSELPGETARADETLVPPMRDRDPSELYSGVEQNRVDSTTEQLTPTSDRDQTRVYSTTNQMQSPIYHEPLSATSRPGESGASSGGVNVNVQGSSEADRTIAAQISQELRTDASLAAAMSEVTISVVDGRVTLRGSVRNEVQKREIESAIQRATGVSSVDNQLRVGSTAEPLPRMP